MQVEKREAWSVKHADSQELCPAQRAGTRDTGARWLHGTAGVASLPADIPFVFRHWSDDDATPSHLYMLQYRAEYTYRRLGVAYSSSDSCATARPTRRPLRDASSRYSADNVTDGQPATTCNVRTQSDRAVKGRAGRAVKGRAGCVVKGRAGHRSVWSRVVLDVWSRVVLDTGHCGQGSCWTPVSVVKDRVGRVVKGRAGHRSVWSRVVLDLSRVVLDVWSRVVLETGQCGQGSCWTCGQGSCWTPVSAGVVRHSPAAC